MASLALAVEKVEKPTDPGSALARDLSVLVQREPRQGAVFGFPNPFFGFIGYAFITARATTSDNIGRFYSHSSLYSQCMLTTAPRVDVMNRLGRAMADPTRSRILLSLLQTPGYPAQLARDLNLTRSNVSNHLTCLRGCGIVVAVPEGRNTRYDIADPHLTSALTALVDVVLAVDDGTPCPGEGCEIPLCCGGVA